MEKIKSLNQQLREARDIKRAVESDLEDIDYKIATIEAKLKYELEKEKDYETE